MNYFPEIRELQKARDYRVCVRCVMDSTYSNTDFDAHGICRHCRNYDSVMKVWPTEAERKNLLEQMINDIKRNGRGRDYDCLFGLSGGVDSSYLACLLKSWGLRVLAIQFDNGWNSELAIKNIELLCKKLSIDLYTHVVEWPEFRDLQLAFLRAGVANIEAPSDHGIFATLYAAGRKHGIKEIITGVNFATEHANVGYDYGYSYSDLKHLKAIHRRFSNTPLRTFPKMHYLMGLLYKNLLGVNVRQPLNLINYSKSFAINYIIDNIGWKPYVGKHGESIITRFHQAYILPKKFKRDKRIIHLSDLIHSEQITREEAMAELEKPPYDPSLIEQDRIFVIKKFNLSEEEFNLIINALPVDYRAYPNSEPLYSAVNRCVKLKRWLKRK
jgi:N-acetyl sugar amidotransferase